MLTTADVIANDAQQLENQNALSITFNSESNANEWQVTNDGVMGGLSNGNTKVDNQALIFSGSVSTENNGGFTSVYKKLAKLSQQIDSVRIQVRGDGNRYQLRIRSQVMGYDVAYKIEFPTVDDQLETHTFKLADFRASFRGRIISNAPELKAETISHVGFLVAAKRSKSFSLSTYAIEFN